MGKVMIYGSTTVGYCTVGAAATQQYVQYRVPGGTVVLCSTFPYFRTDSLILYSTVHDTEWLIIQIYGYGGSVVALTLYCSSTYLNLCPTNWATVYRYSTYNAVQC